jgi:hypothetical protein
MSGLLISQTILTKHKLNNLLKLVDTNKVRNNNNIGYIFIVPVDALNNLNKLPKGDKRIRYVKSTSFTNSIEHICKIIYNIREKLCELRYNSLNKRHLKSILQSLKTHLPQDTRIWTGVITSTETCANYIKMGFTNPHKADTSPLGYKFKKPGIAFIKINGEDVIDFKSTENKLKYALNSNPEQCSVSIRFSPSTVKYLKKLTRGKNEVAGSLFVSKVLTKNGKIVFELEKDENTIETGLEEEVDAVWSRYNFHTHPVTAYNNHGVNKGWPSAQDYIGFLTFDNQTIFHTVATLEGLYIISLSPESKKSVLTKINKNRISKIYDIDHSTDMTFTEYTDNINNRLYNGKRLFVVKYIPWNKATQLFSVWYTETTGSCLVTDVMLNMYKE